MRKTAKLFPVAFLAAILAVSCGGKGGRSWTESDALKNTSTGAGAASISDAHFEPDIVLATAVNEGGVIVYRYSSTLYFYINSINAASQAITVRVKDSDGQESGIAITTTPTVPGWYSTVLQFRDLPKGTHTYEVWLKLADGSESNRLQASFTIETASGFSENAYISNAYFDPNPAVVAYDASLAQATLKLYIHSIKQGADIMTIWVSGGPYGQTRQFAVSSVATIPGWLTMDMYLSDKAGTYTYTVWLELADGSISNKITADLYFQY